MVGLDTPDGRRNGSFSSGDATPTPKTPTNDFFPPNVRLTPSPHYAEPRTGGVALGRPGPGQNLAHIWEDANRATRRMPMPNIVFPESPKATDHLGSDLLTGMRNMSGMSAVQAHSAMDATDWETRLARLHLSETQHARSSSDEPFYHRQNANMSTLPSNGMSAQPVEPAESKRYSIWSTYGNTTSPTPTMINTRTTDPISMGPAGHRSRAASETTITSNTVAQPHARRFASQPSPFPEGLSIRMGQSRPQADPFPVPVQAPRSQGFLPMHAIRTGRHQTIPFQTPSLITNNGINGTGTAAPARFSTRYHGMHTESNASAEYLAPEQNASLWITNLPPDITHHELLGQIRNIGRVWCCFINGPDGLKHTTAAAKIVFFQPKAAQRLLQHSLTTGLQVRGYRAKVTQNRIKTAETTPRNGDDSRVLIITGQAHFVNEKTLTEYFGERFVFQLDEVTELIKGQGRAVMEFKFGSFRCQAQMGKISLEKDRPRGFEKAEFGEDPCEVGETYASHAIALQRIRGIGI